MPAEQYAVRTGTHPRVTTDQNINVFRRQIQELGLSYDWDRELIPPSLSILSIPVDFQETLRKRTCLRIIRSR